MDFDSPLWEDVPSQSVEAFKSIDKKLNVLVSYIHDRDSEIASQLVQHGKDGEYVRTVVKNFTKNVKGKAG